MAIELFGEDAPEPGTRVPWIHGGQEIGLFVRPVPPTVRKRIEQRVMGSLKTRKFHDQPVARTGDQGQRITAGVATYALLDTDGFELLTKSEEVAEAITEAGVQVAPGTAVRLDKRWSDEVKAVVLERLPSLATYVVEVADKLAGIERDQEDELGKTSASS